MFPAKISSWEGVTVIRLNHMSSSLLVFSFSRASAGLMSFASKQVLVTVRSCRYSRQRYVTSGRDVAVMFTKLSHRV